MIVLIKDSISKIPTSHFKNSKSCLLKLLNLKLKLQKLEKVLFFLTILFLPTQLGKHFWPDFSFVYSLRIDYLSPVIYFWDLLVLSLLAVVWLLHNSGKNKFVLNRKFLILFLIFILTQAISSFNAVNPEASLVRIKEFLIVGLFGLYVASKDFNQIKTALFNGLICSMLFVCLLATGQFLLGRSLGFWVLGERNFSVTTPLIARFNFYEEVFLRPYATFPHPNMLAAYLVLTLPILIYGLPEKLKQLKLMLGLLVTSTVFITFSRPGLILVTVQSFLLFRRFWKIWLILGVVITPLVFVRLASVFTFDTLAVLRRQELSNYAIKLFFEHPLAGIGLNNFINVLGSDHVLVGTSRFLQPVHNFFLLILAETGIIGLAGILGLFGTAFWESLKKSGKFPQVLLGNLLMVVFLGLFDHYFLTLPQGQRLLFLILGLSFSKTGRVNNFSNIPLLKRLPALLGLR